MFAGFSFKNFWQIWSPAKPNLSFVWPSIPRYDNLDFPFEKVFPLGKFARVANYRQNFKKLLYVCSVQRFLCSKVPVVAKTELMVQIVN